MTADVARNLSDQVRSLAFEHKIIIDYVPSLWDAGAWTDFFGSIEIRRATIARITDTQTYIAALHEIGHHAMGHTNIPPDLPEARENRIDSEAEAWEWALENSRLPITDEIWDEVRFALGSYLFVQQERGVIGPPGDTFYRLNQRAGGIKPVNASRAAYPDA